MATPLLTAAYRAHGPRAWWLLLRNAFSAWLDDFAPSMGAALSYYTVFSIAPLILVVIGVAGVFFGRDAVRTEVFGELAAMLGTSTARSLEGVVESAGAARHGVLAAVAGVVGILIGATTVLAELQSALDRIWRAPARKRGGGVWAFLRARLLTFGMILGLAFLLMVSLLASAGLAAVSRWGLGGVERFGGLLQLVDLVVGYFVTAALFALIYKLLPREHVAWRDVGIGSLVTAALFTVGKYAIGLYVEKAGVASAYGAAGSLVVMLVWVYYSAQIFLLGAEFTWAYAYAMGSRAGQSPPAAGALPTRAQ